MYQKLQEWFDNNQPEEDLIYKDELWPQVQIIRDVIPKVLARSYEEFIGIKEQTRVISTHVSKSVTLPVFEINWNGYKFVMRYNFYDWKVSVETPYGVGLDVDFMDLFNYKKKINSVYCEGFRNDWVYDSYSKNKQKFTCEIANNNYLFTFFWIVKYNVSKKG